MLWVNFVAISLPSILVGMLIAHFLIDRQGVRSLDHLPRHVPYKVTCHPALHENYAIVQAQGGPPELVIVPHGMELPPGAQVTKFFVDGNSVSQFKVEQPDIGQNINVEA